MKRVCWLLGMTCLALLLVVACGQQEEPAKAQKPAATQAAPEKKAAAPAAKPAAKPATPAQKTAPAKPSPEKK